MEEAVSGHHGLVSCFWGLETKSEAKSPGAGWGERSQGHLGAPEYQIQDPRLPLGDVGCGGTYVLHGEGGS